MRGLDVHPRHQRGDMQPACLAPIWRRQTAKRGAMCNVSGLRISCRSVLPRAPSKNFGPQRQLSDLRVRRLHIGGRLGIGFLHGIGYSGCALREPITPPLDPARLSDMQARPAGDRCASKSPANSISIFSTLIAPALKGGLWSRRSHLVTVISSIGAIMPRSRGRSAHPGSSNCPSHLWASPLCASASGDPSGPSGHPDIGPDREPASHQAAGGG